MKQTFTTGRVAGVIASLLLVDRAFSTFQIEPMELIIPFIVIVVMAMLLIASTAWVWERLLPYT
jgi:hypothetical protein